jgi:hypothetical protein
MARYWWKRLAARLLLAGAGVVGGLGLAELAVRLVRPQPVLLVTRGLYAPDPPRRYRLQPGFRGTVTNRVEYRTPVTVNRYALPVQCPRALQPPAAAERAPRLREPREISPAARCGSASG